jgi:CO/xanthine dehydrogenase Mo-binding subunit
MDKRHPAPLHSAPGLLDGEASAFRNDAASKVTGTALYTDDFEVPGMLHCVPVYTDYVHARIIEIDTERAAGEPGVVAVLTSRDVPGELRYGQINRDLPMFASDKIRSNGDVVAAVVAETREEAIEAAELIKVEAEVLPPLLDPEEAMREDAPRIQDNTESNIVVHHKIRRGEAEDALEHSYLVIEEEFTTAFFEHAYLEPEGALCIPKQDGVMAVYGSLQHPNSTRKFICAYLGLPLTEVEVFSHPVGGSFGGKDDTASVVAARTALAARITGKPVKTVYKREWSVRESYKRPPYTLRYTMGFSQEGKITGAVCRVAADSGAYTSTVPWSTWRATVQCCGPYKTDHVHTDIFGVTTNNVFTGAFRGFGSPQVNFSVEQLLDIAAERLGIGPVEIRRRNMVRQGDETITGQLLDNHTVSMEAVMDAVLHKIDFERKVKQCSFGAESKTDDSGEFYGIGFGICYRGASIGAEGKDFCSCIVNCQFDGSVLLETGIWENGQGAQSAMVLLLASQLGISRDRIRYTESTTSRIPDSGTTVASRGTLLGSGALYDAAVKVKKTIAAVLAPKLDCTPEDVIFRDDRVWSGSGEFSCSWEEAMREMYNARVYPYAFGSFAAPEIWWDEEIGQGEPYFTYVYSCQAAEISVDPKTGKVTILTIVAAHDIGKAVNPAMLKGQIFGGITQGVGMALMEDLAVNQGKITALNYNRYHIPRATDVPDMTPIIIENSDPASPAGCKGIGEPALEIIAPALANAYYRATGKRMFSIPFTGSENG